MWAGKTRTKLLSTMVVMALFALMTGLFAAPAQADDSGVEPTVPTTTYDPTTDTSPLTSPQRSQAMLDKLGREQARDTGGAVIVMVLPDAYRICAPNRCVYVDKTRYCSGGTYCGEQVVSRVNLPSPQCPQGYRCWDTAHGRFKTLSGNATDLTNAQLNSWVKCGVEIGLAAGTGLTRGWGWGAALGVAWATWGCAN
jgi:hypothetical protein